jgi:acetate kinase
VAAAAFLLPWLEGQTDFSRIRAVGHRVVYGTGFDGPRVANRELVQQLRRGAGFDPEHMEGELALLARCLERYPQQVHVACFDNPFHRTMPDVATRLPLPRQYHDQGVRRYGFHGLSYAYLLQELEQLAGAKVARGRIIMAHLGNGASLAAVRRGKSIDTTMGFTPTSGIPMSTRSGDLEPGIGAYLAQSEGMSPAVFFAMANRRSGLLGISQSSSDVRDLLRAEAGDERARQALNLFCYRIKKEIGALCAALGGLDTLIFSGGIGENAPAIRARVCHNLGHLGIRISAPRNAKNQAVISPRGAAVTVRVIKTNEELAMARAMAGLLGKGKL